MLTKPDIADELIISRLQNEYNLRVSSLTFLPLGADMGTAVHRVIAAGGVMFTRVVHIGSENFQGAKSQASLLSVSYTPVFFTDNHFNKLYLKQAASSLRVPDKLQRYNPVSCPNAF